MAAHAVRGAVHRGYERPSNDKWDNGCDHLFSGSLWVDVLLVHISVIYHGTAEVASL